MPEPAWTQQPLPDVGTDAVLGRWQPATLRELTGARLQLSAALHDGARPPGTDEGAVERLLLAYEELVSNALRHGRPPIEVSVTRTGHHWLLQVSDTAADTPPTPAVGRDAALGGLGLPLVAQLSGAHGWTVTGDSKVVWARIDLTRAEPPPIPRPRDEAGRDRETDGPAPP
jgi:signal transduction histidine kinase